jgi:1,4-dihydroxy-2-naphthoate octaprenyltransferase
LAACIAFLEYFKPPSQPILPEETRRVRESLRSALLVAGTSFLVVAAALLALLSLQGALSATTWTFLGAYILLSLAISVPPLRLADNGFGEIAQALLLAVLTPAIGYFLQTDIPHRLLSIFAFPLFLLALSYFIAQDFPAYADHLKHGRRTLLMRLSWDKAVTVHNLLLAAAYLFFVLAIFLNVPLQLTWPAFLTLPVAVYQVYMLQRIADGAKPVWNALLATSTAVFGITAYLVMLTFWLR